MTHWTRRAALGASTLAAGLLACGVLPAYAQTTFPTRALRIIVPTTPGSGSDITARYFGEQLAAALGQSVVIENRAGGNGAIAAMAVKSAPADGYTIFLGTNTHMAVNPIVIKDLPYDPVKDFKPVAGLARGMMILLAGSNTPYPTLGSLVQAARGSSKQMNVGSYTSGFQLAGEWFAAQSKTKHVYVSYRGAPEVYLGLMGGQLDWAISDLIASIPQVKAGKLKALAVTGETRHPDLPDVPTAKESGFPEYVNYTWTSMYIRSEVPEAISTKLVDTMQKILATQGAKDFTRQIGSDPMPLAPTDMRKFQLSETERFRAIAASAGITPQ